MFSIIPADWENPRPKHWFGAGKKTVESLADYLPPTVPNPMPKPVQVEKSKEISANTDLERAMMVMPLEELCLGETLADTTEIDEMLTEVFTPTTESRARQIFRMIDVINQNIAKNILRLKNSPIEETDYVSKEDLLKLLQTFLNYSRSLENHLKTVIQVKTI